MLSSSPLEKLYDNGGLRRHNGQGFLVEQLRFSPNVSKPAAIAPRAHVFQDNQSRVSGTAVRKRRTGLLLLTINYEIDRY